MPAQTKVGIWRLVQQCKFCSRYCFWLRESAQVVNEARVKTLAIDGQAVVSGQTRPCCRVREMWSSCFCFGADVISQTCVSNMCRPSRAARNLTARIFCKRCRGSWWRWRILPLLSIFVVSRWNGWTVIWEQFCHTLLYPTSFLRPIVIERSDESWKQKNETLETKKWVNIFHVGWSFRSKKMFLFFFFLRAFFLFLLWPSYFVIYSVFFQVLVSWTIFLWGNR